MAERKNYETEALKLSKACDIAIEALEKFPPKIWDEKTVLHIINCYREEKHDILNPLPQYKKIASLKYAIESTFTMFNESSGDFVEYFWKEIKSQNLDYVREDKLGKILKRGRIKDFQEFDYITDTMVPAVQESRITNEEFKSLSEMLGHFENRKSK